ncbi:MAG: hypothetical protein Q9217_007027 [Psora testacea]
MPPSLYQKAQATHKLREVAMDEVAYLKFSKEGHRYLGTENLSGCTAVVIVSLTAAILAHVAPRPSLQNENQATGDVHVTTKMKAVKNLLEQYKSDFSGQQAGAVVAYAVYEGKVALESQIKVIGAQLTAWKLYTNPIPYNVTSSTKDKSAEKGSVIVDATGKVPVVFVEDRDVTSKVTGSSAIGPSKATKS